MTFFRMASKKIILSFLIISISIIYFIFINYNNRDSKKWYPSDFLRLWDLNDYSQNDTLSETYVRYVRHCITEEILGVIRNVTVTEPFSMSNDSWTESPGDRKLAFQSVFKNRAWGKDWDKSHTGLSASGGGSTLHWAQDVIGVLHKVVNEIKRVKGSNYKVRILDVPCGDFAWMNRFLTTRDDINYTGMDIVPDLIEHHNKKFKHENWKFVVGDVVVMETLEDYDIILCRMVLQHLSLHDGKRVLNLFSKNSNGLLITTSFSLMASNAEVPLGKVGRSRDLNLEIPPFSLSPPICLARDGLNDVFSIFIGIWKLPIERVSKCITPYSFKVKAFDANLFSCSQWSEA